VTLPAPTVYWQPAAARAAVAAATSLSGVVAAWTTHVRPTWQVGLRLAVTGVGPGGITAPGEEDVPVVRGMLLSVLRALSYLPPQIITSLRGDAANKLPLLNYVLCGSLSGFVGLYQGQEVYLPVDAYQGETTEQADSHRSMLLGMHETAHAFTVGNIGFWLRDNGPNGQGWRADWAALSAGPYSNAFGVWAGPGAVNGGPPTFPTAYATSAYLEDVADTVTVLFDTPSGGALEQRMAGDAGLRGKVRMMVTWLQTQGLRTFDYLLQDTPPPPPPPPSVGSLAPPTGISFVPGGTFADLSWAPIDGAQFVDYEWKDTRGSQELGESRKTPTTSARVTSGTAVGMVGPTYLFRVRGVRDLPVGEERGAWSDWFPYRTDVLTPAPPPPTPPPPGSFPAVTGVRVVPGSTDALVLWDEHPLRARDELFGYQLEWRTAAGSYGAQARQPTLPDALRATVGDPAYGHAPLLPGGDYLVRVRAQSNRTAEYGDWSVEVPFRTATAPAPVLTPPPAPDVQAVTATTADVILPPWAPGDEVWSYDVEWQAAGDLTWSAVTRALGTVRLTPLRSETSYRARLRAYVLPDGPGAVFRYTDYGPERPFRTAPTPPPPPPVTPPPTPPVTPPVVTEPPPPDARPDPFTGGGRIETGCTTIYVRDSTLERVGEVDDFTELDVTLAENAAGPWKLVMPAAHPMALAMTFRSGLEVWRNDRLLMSGPVSRISAKREGREHVLTVEGYDDNDVLTGRLALPNPLDAARPQSGSFFGSDVFRGTAEAALRYFVGRNVGPSAVASRRVPDLTLDPDQGRGRVVTARPPRFDQLLPFLSRLAFGAGVSFRVEQRGTSRAFTVRQPADRSRDVVFGLDRGNLLGYELVTVRPAANYVYTGGPGVAAARVVWLGQDAESISAYGRREVFLDESGAQSNDEGITVAELLEEATQQELAEQRQTVSITLQPQDTPETQYGRDYDLGDLVTVRLEGGGELVERIGEVRYLLTPTSERVVPTVASDGKSRSTQGLPGRLRRTSRRLAAVEGS
jgi:hypothetical protein